MLTVRPAAERGLADFGWLKSRHTFSFGEYFDPRHMGFRALRVINDDVVAGGGGFPTHPHRDMEIVSYVLSGSLVHKDSMGNGSTIQRGDIQRMSAGTGVTHSEFNGSRTEAVHFLQIWIIPAARGGAPGYEQIQVDDDAKDGVLRLVASPDGRDGSVTLRQDVCIYAGRFGGGQTASLPLAPGRYGWVQVAAGTVTVNGLTLGEGDGLALTDEPSVEIRDGVRAEVLVFDLN